jgi:Flp pilus assembly protein TadD
MAGILMMTAGVAPSPAQGVRAWLDTAPIPTYYEAPPETTPTFEALFGESAVYPYTARPNFTNRRSIEKWRIIHLENEYLHCRFLPDVGGHLYSCVDKINGREMFYANSSLRKLAVGLRGAWVALGIEPNFPIGHSRQAVSPVEFAIRENSDKSVSVWLAALDRVSGMQWRTEFLLRPQTAALEENVYLYNRTGGAHNYYWWNNAAVILRDPDTRFIMPTRVVSDHGTTYLESWPITPDGRDISLAKNHPDMFAMFAYGCNEPFAGVYEPRTRAGLLHLADPKVLPGKKAWDWGTKENVNLPARVSEDGSTYIEVQFGNQQNEETAELMPPGTALRFAEIWLPFRDLGGVSRATADAVLNLGRKDPGQLTIELNVVRSVRNGKLTVRQGDRSLYEETVTLEPPAVFHHAVEGVSADPVTVTLSDASGRALLSHTENQYDAVAAGAVKLGPQPEAPEPKRETEDGALAWGHRHETEGLLWAAHEDYARGLASNPDSSRLHMAIGKVALNLQRYEEALTHLRSAQSKLPDNSELRYYLGHALLFHGEQAEARANWEAIRADRQFGPAATLEMGGLAARAGQWKDALASFRLAAERSPDQIRVGVYEVALLRRLEDAAAARTRLAYWRALDPTSVSLRSEAALLGVPDDHLLEDLGADPERILDVADDYLFLGMPDEALALLSREYPAAPENQREAGGVPAQSNPLIAYYRGYIRQMKGQPPEKDFALAATLPNRYIFPYRASSYAVLRAAIKANPEDATAHLLLGHLLMNSVETDQAIVEWQKARSLRPGLPGLGGALGRTLLDLRPDPTAAVVALQDGLTADPGNHELQRSLERAAERLSPGAALPIPPTGIANLALLRAAMGQAGALAFFTAANFPKSKQPDEVRRAYIELQLQQLVRIARGKQCEAAREHFDIMDAINPLPLTSAGFGVFMKTLRFQYYLGVVEAACGDEKGASKRWSKIAKTAVPDVSSEDYAFPLLAALRLNTDTAKSAAEAAVLKLRDPDATAKASSKDVSMWNEGLLLRELGKEDEAMALFEAGLKGAASAWIQYLNLLAIEQR